MRRARGFSLPELMVSLAIGLLLLAGFFPGLAPCRPQVSPKQSLASLQDAARRTLSVLVADVEHAGFRGNTNAAQLQVVRDGVLLAEGDQLRQPDASRGSAPVSGLPAGAHACGDNFALDFALPVQA